MVTQQMTSRDPERSSFTPMRLKPNISKAAGVLFSNNRQLLDSLVWGSTVVYPSDRLASKRDTVSRAV